MVNLIGNRSKCKDPWSSSIPRLLVVMFFSLLTYCVFTRVTSSLTSAGCRDVGVDHLRRVDDAVELLPP